jgi:hypothetical protein
MSEQDLRTFIRDVTRRNERVFQEHLKQWQKLHERVDRMDARSEVRAKIVTEQLQDLVEESRAQRAGLFKLIDAIRDLEKGFGGSSPA